MYYSHSDLVLDEIGYEKLNPVEVTLLFRFVSSCAEWISLVITTNKSFDEGVRFIEDTDIITAIVDRLIYKSEIINIDGPPTEGQEADHHGMEDWQTSALVDGDQL